MLEMLQLSNPEFPPVDIVRLSLLIPKSGRDLKFLSIGDDAASKQPEKQ